jgi:large subunit ribosomal protein L4
MQLKVTSTIGSSSSLTVSDVVFGAELNPTLIAQAIRVYQANQRQATAKTKTRGEINRTKKKWFKQKGTGNARHGARTPSIFVGGGVAHGPHGNQNFSLKMSQSMRKAALASALTAQLANIHVTADLSALDGKTSSAQKLLAKMVPAAQHILVVLADNNEMTLRSLRNLENVLITQASRLTTYEVAFADAIVMSKEAVKVLEARYADTPAKAEKKEVKAEVKTEAVKAEKKADQPATKKTVAKTKPAVKKEVKKAVKKTK